MNLNSNVFMYVELSNLGVISGVNAELEGYLNDLSSIRSNFFELVKNRECCPMACERFLNRFSMNKVETLTYEYQTKRGVLWVEWVICKITTNKLVAIG